MASFGTVHVEGFRGLDRAFKQADAALHGELRGRLAVAAERPKARAEQLALTDITKMTVPWSQMRVGVTSTSVYIAPAQRGKRGRGRAGRRRPNLAGLLLNRAMLPAVEENEAHVVAAVDDLLGDLGRRWERA